MHQFWHVIYVQKSATLTGHSALSLDRYRNCAKIFSEFLSSPTMRQVKKATNIYIWLNSTRWRKAVYNILHLQIRHKVKSLLSFPRTTRWKNVTDIAPNLSRVEGILKFFLLFDTASVVVSVSIAATKCHSSMLSKTRQRSVVVFSFFAFLCIVIDFTRSHASTYKDNYVSWSRRKMKGGHFIFYKTPRECTLKWPFGRALHVARNNIIPASF